MRWQLALASSMFLVGCPPGPMGQPYFPNLTANWDYVEHLGDKLTFGADAPDATVVATIKNAGNGQAQAIPPAGPKGEVTLDATNLPGYDGSADLQAYEVELEVRWHGGTNTQTRDFLLVTDREVTLLPSAPTEFGTQAPAPLAPPLSASTHWRSTDSDEGPAAYVQHLVTTWPIPSPTISSAPVPRDGFFIRSEPPFAWLPAEAQLVRYEVRAAFPKYVVPDAGSARVLAPTMLELTLSHTDPALLIAMKVS